MSSNQFKKCPLCRSEQISLFDKGPLDRRFYKCARCFLLFTTEANQPGKEEEKDRYLTHNNSPEDEGYVDFLNRAVEPSLNFIKPGMQGLDYGCGPGPAISELLEKKGISCENYDPLFYPKWKEGPFDFIFSTETFEHFFHPDKEMDRLNELLKPGGYLIVMTVLWDESVDLNDWFYARDKTHVCFYHRKTLNYIAEHYGFNEKYNDGERVFIFQDLGD